VCRDVEVVLVAAEFVFEMHDYVGEVGVDLLCAVEFVLQLLHHLFVLFVFGGLLQLLLL
jgi:hypothetical protein